MLAWVSVNKCQMFSTGRLYCSKAKVSWSSSQSLPALSDWNNGEGGERKEEAVSVNGIPAGLYMKSFQDTQNASFRSIGRHILNKTNYLVDIYNPAEVCDNGAPCLLRQTHAFSPQRAAKWPSPASVAEECTPIPCCFPLCLPVPASQARENTLA